MIPLADPRLQKTESKIKIYFENNFRTCIVKFEESYPDGFKKQTNDDYYRDSYQEYSSLLGKKG
jgi:hypothetical protein